MFAGKELLISETALKDFQTILSTVGGDREKERAHELLKRVTVVPDSPSPRTELLKGSGKIKKRPRVRKLFSTLTESIEHMKPPYMSDPLH